MFAPEPLVFRLSPAGLGLEWVCRRSRVRSKTAPGSGVQVASSHAAPAPGGQVRHLSVKVVSSASAG